MIEVTAPAKLNLGLEILGRRDDGYHEIRTLMAPVSLVDTLVMTCPGRGKLHVDGLALPADGNIVSSAMELMTDAWHSELVDVRLTKRIPPASGLGGGSSDAAATLLGMSRLFGRDPSTLLDYAAQLGSDVPFFVTGVSALVSGRGEVITALPEAPPTHAVIVAPSGAIPRKTATLYAALTPADFSDGSTIGTMAPALGAMSRRQRALPNAFRRALYDLVPELSHLARAIERIAARPSNVTGAGPAHYVLCHDKEDAATVGADLREALQNDGVSIYPVATVSGITIREVADVR